MGQSKTKKDLAVHCKECNEMTDHELVVEGKVGEEWKCKVCGNARLFGK